MDDIARDLQISKSTISFIINGKAKEMRISDKLATKVLDYVKEKNYNRNALAQSLRTGKSKIIGLIVEDIADAFFSSVARLIEEKAYKKGYKIIYCSTEDNPKKTIELINMFKGRNVDGFIITAPKGIESEVALLLKQNHPFVLFDRYFPELETDYVIINNFDGAKTAIDHLAAEGFKQIAFITLASDQTQMAERLNGYNHAIHNASLDSYVLEVKFTAQPEKVVKQINSFLTKNKGVDAILFATNYLAMQGLQAIKEQNLVIPDDVAVVGFDDHAFFKVFNPPISAVSQPMKNLSDNLIDVLFKQMTENEPGRKIIKKVLEPQLIIRESSLKKS